jgi:hypothetical protein
MMGAGVRARMGRGEVRVIHHGDDLHLRCLLQDGLPGRLLPLSLRRLHRDQDRDYDVWN